MNNTDTAKLSLMFALCFCISIGIGMFVLKNQVQTLESELNRVNASIEEDVQSIHVLKAEWSHLNSPQRLRTLASKHISLNPARAEQIINFSELPFDYEPSKPSRRQLAQKNINRQAERNRNLKKLVKAQH